METKKIAKYWKKLDNGKVQCTLCPHNCILKNGQLGICKTRVNEGGKLFTIAFANPVAAHIDPIEKKPLVHFYPTSKAFSIATAGCNLSCKNCQNWEISQASPLDLDSYFLPPEQVVELAIKYGSKSIAYTYTDPIAFYEYTLETAKLAHKNNLKNVLISAGFINEEPLRELAPYIDAANIDLKSFDPKIYKRLNAGDLEPVLRTLKILKEYNVWLEITNLIIPGWTDDLEMIRKMCKWLVDNGFEQTPLHFSRFHPTYKLLDVPSTPVPTLEKAIEIAKQQGMKYVFIGNVWGHTAENTYCPKCGKPVILREGFSVKEFHLKDGKCEYCGNPIAGIWQ